MTSAFTRPATWLLVAGLVLAVAPPAGAKIYFGTLPRVLTWHQAVSSTVAGCPGNPSCAEFVEGARVYLRRGAGRRPPRTVRGLRRLGRITRSGTIRFRVPPVPVGRYHLVVAVPLSAGGTRPAVASPTFRIRRR
jgi:hypothetical protein